MINRILGILLFIILSPILLIAYAIILFSDGNPIIFKQKRLGLNEEVFDFYKFRTMKTDAPNIASHLLPNPDIFLLPFGKFFRKHSIDELPNLINVIKGEMGLIGPRPILLNQYDLIQKRRKHGINKLKPGITGWVQVNGRDKTTIDERIALDKFYLENKSIYLNFKILLLTIKQIFHSKGVSH